MLTITPAPEFPVMDAGLQAMLEAQGFVFASTVGPATDITPTLPRGVDILFVQETAGYNDPQSPGEADTLANFVRGATAW